MPISSSDTPTSTLFAAHCLDNINQSSDCMLKRFAEAANMTGISQYKSKEVEFVLKSIVRKAKPAQIMQDFSLQFGRSLNPNQIRYIKNKYGKDPRFGSPLVNYKGQHAGDLDNFVTTSEIDENSPRSQSQMTSPAAPALPQNSGRIQVSNSVSANFQLENTMPANAAHGLSLPGQRLPDGSYPVASGCYSYPGPLSMGPPPASLGSTNITQPSRPDGIATQYPQWPCGISSEVQAHPPAGFPQCQLSSTFKLTLPLRGTKSPSSQLQQTFPVVKNAFQESQPQGTKPQDYDAYQDKKMSQLVPKECERYRNCALSRLKSPPFERSLQTDIHTTCLDQVTDQAFYPLPGSNQLYYPFQGVNPLSYPGYEMEQGFYPPDEMYTSASALDWASTSSWWNQMPLSVPAYPGTGFPYPAAYWDQTPNDSPESFRDTGPAAKKRKTEPTNDEVNKESQFSQANHHDSLDARESMIESSLDNGQVLGLYNVFGTTGTELNTHQAADEAITDPYQLDFNNMHVTPSQYMPSSDSDMKFSLSIGSQQSNEFINLMADTSFEDNIMMFETDVHPSKGQKEVSQETTETNFGQNEVNQVTSQKSMKRKRSGDDFNLGMDCLEDPFVDSTSALTPN